ncbi:MAG TPA: HlyD family type I secretion periplasmic adaptor subunit [Methylophaga sp.]|jgi:membrane fusion protein, adhesin transport system|uniref:HlyD family type I secretion periplasmic adaptor subunit n=1 Tax=unclassified Methylophaga TaxID=2629249 RepID=UPI000E98EA29|nr:MULTISPECIES: HlyD family type I secretion periplasmic adaptor subunit [unclassified Methylophaga]HAD30960.1 HlyD family type I secretion periplasmic adaptor subunit [Methylophaga sp.]HBX61141.1 HlyD family type I secretion periplasmic adaptor subunit [Methylophaga sp.]|tara:strand:- start:14206 stop:15534 length:1329 start_codon:yes stop_codon:yes gene_type:complete
MAWFKKNNDDVNFMSEISAATMASTHWGGHILLLLIAAFIGIALWWASVAEIDEVTRGQGKVVPSSKVQIIQNLEGGILADVLVSEGQMVEKGDVLLKIDDTRFSSSFRESKLTYWELLARTARLSAESEGKPLELPEELMINQPELAAEERGLYQSRQLQLQSTIDVLKRQAEQRRQELVEKQARQQQLSRSFELSNQELQMSEPLLAAGVMSEVEILRLKRTVNDLRGEMESNRLAIPRIRSSIDEVQQKINEAVTRFESEAARELSEVRAEMERTEESVSALKDRVTRTNVRSPMKGTIKRLMINTIGGVIQPGMDLVEIVPLEDNLLIEAQIRPADIAFLRPGQEAIIKFTAYDFSIYGGLNAKLVRISADTITNEEDESFYLIYLRTEQNFIKSSMGELGIIPGMTVTVDILTGEKTVLDYLLKPILKAKNEALRER